MTTKRTSKNESSEDQQRPPKELTAKERVFVGEYLIDLNQTQAAIRAGYSARTASVTGHKLLRKANVAAAIQAAQQKRAARVEITQERVLLEVARLAFLDYRKFVNDDGSVKPIHELDDDTAAALAGLDVFEEFEGRGEDRVQIGFTKKLKVFDKKGALELLMRHMGMLNDKVKLQGDAENPLVLLLRQMQGTSLKPTAGADDASD